MRKEREGARHGDLLCLTSIYDAYYIPDPINLASLGPWLTWLIENAYKYICDRLKQDDAKLHKELIEFLGGSTPLFSPFLCFKKSNGGFNDSAVDRVAFQHPFFSLISSLSSTCVSLYRLSQIFSRGPAVAAAAAAVLVRPWGQRPWYSTSRYCK